MYNHESLNNTINNHIYSLIRKSNSKSWRMNMFTLKENHQQSPILYMLFSNPITFDGLHMHSGST